MKMDCDIQELEEKKRLGLKMGGDAKIALQHQRGLLTARERIDQLLDPVRFLRLGRWPIPTSLEWKRRLRRMARSMDLVKSPTAR